MTTRLVDKGWKKELSDALAADSSDVRIVSPYIKTSVIEWLLKRKPINLQVITRFNLADFAKGGSDISALQKLREFGAQVRGIKNLHAKLYIFGSTRAIVTSANLTEAGLNRNLEFGVVSEDDATADVCLNYFAKLWEGAGEASDDEIKEWIRKIEKWQLQGGRPNDTADLKDCGAEIELEKADGYDVTSIANVAEQSFIKFLGRSPKEHREPLDTRVFDVIESSDCHRALSHRKRPAQVHDGAVMFIGRFTRDPNDIRVFGRAVGIKYKPGRDDAQNVANPKIGWRSGYPYFIRVHSAEFVAGTLENGVSLNELMDALGHEAFASTQRNYRQGRGNTNPRRALLQQPRVQLTPKGNAWLAERLQEKINTYGKVPQAELDTIVVCPTLRRL